MREITVTVFDNGMVAVWGMSIAGAREQIPDLQGPKDEAAELIAAWVRR